MPLDIPATAAELIDDEPKFVEPQLPAEKAGDWQGTLRQIFETESGIWQRRHVARHPAASRA